MMQLEGISRPYAAGRDSIPMLWDPTVCIRALWREVLLRFSSEVHSCVQWSTKVIPVKFLALLQCAWLPGLISHYNRYLWYLCVVILVKYWDCSEAFSVRSKLNLSLCLFSCICTAIWVHETKLQEHNIPGCWMKVPPVCILNPW